MYNDRQKPTTRSVASSRGAPAYSSRPSSSCPEYNKAVVNAQRQNDSHKHHRHAVYATETSGLLLIAFLLLALTLIRYWHVIHWSVR
jgi:hypothetical protein